MAGAIEQLIVFRAPFASPWLAAVRTKGDEIVGEAGEECATGVTAMTAGAQGAVGPGLQGIERPLEAEAIEGNVMGYTKSR